MTTKIIGRTKECTALKNCYESDKAELIAVYGRRRIGKTFLVKNFFRDKIDFYVTGIYEGTKQEQLTFFNKQLQEYSGIPYPMVPGWFDAFDQLKHYIKSLKKNRTVVFIDELPWLDTPRSGFLKAFDLFYEALNNCADRDLRLVILVNDNDMSISRSKGGLHNRVTYRMKLAPFNLAETEEFLKTKGMVWNRYQIAETYMTLGGTPFYLQMLEKGLSPAQNTDRLFFSENAMLRDEYSFLFRSLFNDSAIYRSTVELLSRKARGMTRSEMMSSLKLPEGGNFSQVLENLCKCDFIRRYYAFGKKERDAIYQLSDLYTLFYLRFVRNTTAADGHLWSNMIDSPERRTWSGYSFEQLCLHHIPQIKAGLGISGIQSSVSSWNTAAADGHKGGQIDLIIDRRDQTVNLCEMKFSSGPFEITKKYLDQMQERRELFRAATKTRKALHLTMVTTYGLKPNAWSGMIQNEIVPDYTLSAKMRPFAVRLTGHFGMTCCARLSLCILVRLYAFDNKHIINPALC